MVMVLKREYLFLSIPVQKNETWVGHVCAAQTFIHILII